MAASLNIVAEQYSSYTLDLTINNADSTPMNLADKYGVFKVARMNDDTKVLEFSGITGDNKVTVTDAQNGQIQVFIKQVTLEPILSSDITKEKPDYYYTLSIVDNTTEVSTRILDGLMSVSKGIA